MKARSMKAGPLAADVVLAVALAAAGVALTTTADRWGATPDRAIDGVGYALVAGAGLILAARRLSPLAVLVASAALTAAYLVIGYVYGPILVLFAVAAYTAARYRPLARSAPAAAVSLLLLLTHLFFNSAALPGYLGLIPASAWVAVPFAIGFTVRQARESADRARAEAVRRRLDEERLRVAQEVHDVVGHGLAAIKMQADVALHLLAKRPEQAEATLESISRTSGDALDELRATLAVVRRTGADDRPASTPGLDQLDELLRRMSEAGVQVDMHTTGQRGQVPAAVDLAGYRVVQESLTNVLRHSGSKRASVAVTYHADVVVIEVTNPVNGAPGPGGGLGIPGMRQRVQAVGGEFSAGPTTGGTFQVHARLPIGGQR